MTTSLIGSVYICKEIFDENSEPTKLEIEEQAFRLGIDLVKEPHLLCIAKQCLLEPLPFDWLPCFIVKENKYFYFNTLSKTSQWEHPLDEHYRHIVEKTRSEDSSTGKDISLNVILDEDNSLDTMYHTKNMNYEKKNVTEKRTVRFKTPIEESLDLDNSDDMKFLGPIKLNTPYTSATSSILQNLPKFSITNTFDSRNTASRSELSKYNVLLPSKNEILKTFDTNENINKTNDDFLRVDIGKENLRKIDITLTESSDQSESTSSEMHTDNLNTDCKENEVDDTKYVSSVQLNSRQEKNDVHNDKTISANDRSFNKIQSMTGGCNIQDKYSVKKDVSDSGNSTAKDSKTIQSSMATDSFSAAKNKMAEITQEFPLKKTASETKPLKTISVENDDGIFDVKYIRAKSYVDQVKNSGDNIHSLMEDLHVKVLIEKHFDSIQNKLEDTIKTKETIFREEFTKQIDDIIRKQNDKFEKHIKAQHNNLFTKNELEFKNLMEEKTRKLLIKECEKKCVENISSAEQMCLEKLSMFQKELQTHAETFKKQIQSELKVMSDELKKEFCKNSENVTNCWSETLVLYKNDELDKVKKDFEQTMESVKHDTNTELHKFNQEFREKLKAVSKVKLKDATDQLDLALSNEIKSVKSRVNRNDHNITSNVQPTHKPPSLKLCVDSLGQKLYSADLQRLNMNKINHCCNDIREKIQHCSNELNNTLKLVNEITATSECTQAESCLCSNKCTVSCQTENIMIADLSPSLNKCIYPEESSNMSVFNNLYDVNSKYADNYWNQARSSRNICSNHLPPCSHVYNSPLSILSQEELKVNAAEQDICRLFDSFKNINSTDVYRVPVNTNFIHQNKFNNFYQTQMPMKIPFNRTKDLREWLYKTDLRNENKWN